MLQHFIYVMGGFVQKGFEFKIEFEKGFEKSIEKK